jgi:uncharacterized membrane protein YqjE
LKSDPNRPSASAALLASLQGLSGTVLGIAQTRLALLATEVEEEKQRVLRALAWGALALLLGTMACLFLALLITVVFWDTHRLLALSVVTAVFLFGALLAAWQFRQQGGSAVGGALAASLAELGADCAALAAAAGRGRDQAAAQGVQSEVP